MWWRGVDVFGTTEEGEQGVLALGFVRDDASSSSVKSSV